MDEVKIKIQNNPTVKKGAKYFIKKMRKSVNGNLQSFVQSLFSLGKQLSGSKHHVSKRKNSKVIPVQSSSISRRVVKHRGKGKSILGRKPKDLKKRTQ